MVDLVVRLALTMAYQCLRVWWRVAHPTGQGAFVAVWHADTLLLIRNSYRAGETTPCGGIDPGETPREAARRELREEVGIDVPEAALRFACQIELHHQGKCDVASFFELHCESPPAVRIDGREVSWAAFVPRRELPGRPLVPHLEAYLARRSKAAS